MPTARHPFRILRAPAMSQPMLGTQALAGVRQQQLPGTALLAPSYLFTPFIQDFHKLGWKPACGKSRAL